MRDQKKGLYIRAKGEMYPDKLEVHVFISAIAFGLKLLSGSFV